jgi:anthranilate synthase component 2
MKTIIIDNYDSFTYNLYQYIGELGGKPEVFRNDALTLEKLRLLKPSRIVISPGATDPSDDKYFGLCRKIIAECGKKIPLLGVCLGHQGIIYVFGGKIVRAPQIMHGKTSFMHHDGKGVFTGVKNPFLGMRYHSLVGEAKTLPSCLEISAWAQTGARTLSADSKQQCAFDPSKQSIMGVRHKEYPLQGIQFHPESIGTEEGKKILKNFLFENQKYF